jgi:ABC-type phosphate/phosphonate transport system permease subunit
MEAINQIKDKAEGIFDDATEYLEARWNLGVLNASSKAADTISTLATTIVMAVIGTIILIFLSVGVALLIGEKLNSPSSGFFYVGLFYVVVGILIYAIKDKYIKLPIVNSFIKKFYYED